MMGLVGLSRANVIWNADTTSSFDVTFNGVGVDLGNGEYKFGPSSALLSPTGLWQIYSGESAYFYSAGMGGSTEWEMQGGSQVSYLPSTLPSDYPDYAGPAILRSNAYDVFLSGTTPSPHDGNRSDYVGLSFFGWQGQSTIAISMPNPSDMSTWTWTAHYWASGSDLNVNVTDSGQTFSMVGSAVIILVWFRRRFLGVGCTKF
jgi:hypothetical protein